jgi:hypothetical protein
MNDSTTQLQKRWVRVHEVNKIGQMEINLIENKRESQQSIKVKLNCHHFHSFGISSSIIRFGKKRRLIRGTTFCHASFLSASKLTIISFP